ncbi:MAG: Hpt domain-containing protein [Bacteroidales bacterium]|nr:Hpt domain-containing protein [Bacteroidales bacterium]
MDNGNLYDMAFLNRVSGGDTAFIREMINTFMEVAPVYVQKARTFLQEENIDALARETHRIIPGVTFVGAKSLEAELMLIEEYAKKKSHLEQLPALIDTCDDLITRLIEAFTHDFS